MAIGANLSSDTVLCFTICMTIFLEKVLLKEFSTESTTVGYVTKYTIAFWILLGCKRKKHRSEKVGLYIGTPRTAPQEGLRNESAVRPAAG